MAKYEYDYYSGAECDQFRYVKVPKVFFEDPDYAELGLAECVLYGFLHEQVAMSKKNGWVDDQGHTYIIRTISSMQEVLRGCSEDKARETLKHLIDFGLIEKKRRGQGKPDLIYVKNFVTKKPEKSGSENLKKEEMTISEPEKNGVLKVENTKTRVGKYPALDSENSVPKELDINKTDLKETHSFLQYADGCRDDGQMDLTENMIIENDFPDVLAVERLVKERIAYDHYMEYLKADYRRVFEILYQHIVRMLVGKRDVVTVQGATYPHKYVKQMFFRIDSDRIINAVNQLAEKRVEMHNSSGYLDSVLFNVATATEVKEIMDNGGMYNPYTDTVVGR